ncbi:MAG: metallophosphoesterase [Anaerovoracaceae bacterium]|nr:metallophosphoesterase [Bacillota bacterium]MDY3953962.1 metallophosphoesterase [Anaerovoracaceae bacterium]
MNTKRRLDQVFEKAFPIPFDNSSKFVFFSDMHRGDDSLADEFGRNRHIYDHALMYYYDSDFTYVEVGDGDELIEQANFKRIYSSHPWTFELLKQFFDDNRMVMLFGNHNFQLANPNFVQRNYYHTYDDYTDSFEPLFPGIHVHESVLLTHRETDQKIFVVHGHQGNLISDQLSIISYIGIRFFWRFMHALGVRYAASPARNRERRRKVEKIYARWSAENNTMIICGHTHRPRFARPGEEAYFNTGCCIHPRGIHCLELSFGKISLVTWRMHSKEDGSLYIKRTVLQGPVPIEEFLRK